MSSFLGTKYARGIRNNNVGNLVRTNLNWLGKIPHSKNTDGRFEQFTEVKFGIRAMLRDIIHDIDKGKNTIRKLISEYAPPFENNTANYVDHVAKALGVSSDAPIKVINNKMMSTIARAIIVKENGKDSVLIKDKDIQDGINILGKFETKVTVDPTKNIIKAIAIPLVLFFYTVFMITL